MSNIAHPFLSKTTKIASNHAAALVSRSGRDLDVLFISEVPARVIFDPSSASA
jgi:hypothetical protein